MKISRKAELTTAVVQRRLEDNNARHLEVLLPIHGDDARICAHPSMLQASGRV